ncbi:MAG: fibronectin type III domain-containing protein [Acidimicrobiales bacterium]
MKALRVSAFIAASLVLVVAGLTAPARASASGLSAPQSVVAIASDGTVSLSWSSPDGIGSGVTHFEIETLINGASNVNLIYYGNVLVGPSARSYVTNTTKLGDSALGEYYSFIVTAVDSSGERASARSNSVLAVDSQDAVQNVTAVASSGVVTVSWSSPSKPTGIVNTYDVESSPPGLSLNLNTASKESATFNDVPGNISYTFKVWSEMRSGASFASEPSNVITPVGAPSPPENISVTPLDTSESVGWSPPTDDGGSPISGYTVTALPGKVSCAVSAPANSCELNLPADGSQFQVLSVVAYNGYGGSTPIYWDASSPNLIQPDPNIEESTGVVARGSEGDLVFTAPLLGTLSGLDPTGSVAIKSGSRTLCTITLGSPNNFCALSPYELAVGTYSATPTYSGDANYESVYSRSIGFDVVLPSKRRLDTVMFTESRKTTVFGKESNVRFVVQILAATGGGIPLGKVAIRSGSATLCVASLTVAPFGGSRAACTLSSSALKAGRHSIAAFYLGSKYFASEPSPNVILTVRNPPAPPPTTSGGSGGGSSGGGVSGGQCYPLTNGGNCYEPGEYCRDSDHGVTGVAGDGERILCRNNNGWRWEPY